MFDSVGGEFAGEEGGVVAEWVVVAEDVGDEGTGAPDLVRGGREPLGDDRGWFGVVDQPGIRPG
ncbi:hypothetical protein [Streptosporangium sp. NPDC049078]|uniref:hypothetical protein n=1 Tax=Streptosporangium sp. NPDC049078 TaxID=3155767 RepID=UPI003428BBE8